MSVRNHINSSRAAVHRALFLFGQRAEILVWVAVENPRAGCGRFMPFRGARGCRLSCTTPVLPEAAFRGLIPLSAGFLVDRTFPLSRRRRPAARAVCSPRRPRGFGGPPAARFALRPPRTPGCWGFCGRACFDRLQHPPLEWRFTRGWRPLGAAKKRCSDVSRTIWLSSRTLGR